MKKKCIIIHGCPSDSEDQFYNKHWIPWTKEQLIAKGIETETPIMPSPWEPDYTKFKAELEKLTVDENTILVGHSCGCAFLVRWLGETKTKISKLILVAPWKVADKRDRFREEFYTYDIDKSISSRVSKIVMFTSDNEEQEGKDSLKLFHAALGGEIVELKGRGHYTQRDMGTEEFPELVEKISD
ncbi:alpha/beta hydrolase [Candidatus Dojkabacteria bacterium]|nr:alpha/beta hydrolase [Candidatus Dojkabacteria bacterium]